MQLNLIAIFLLVVVFMIAIITTVVWLCFVITSTIYILDYPYSGLYTYVCYPCTRVHGYHDAAVVRNFGTSGCVIDSGSSSTLLWFELSISWIWFNTWQCPTARTKYIYWRELMINNFSYYSFKANFQRSLWCFLQQILYCGHELSLIWLSLSILSTS